MFRKKDKTEKKKETWDETIRSFLFAVVIALVFRSVAFEPFHIPSGSMLSTLYEGDYLFVSKYSYGYSRFSFPLSLPIFKGRILNSAPQRGDVVVFRLPTNTQIDFIKRVIGLPGDRVQMKHDRLYINGELVEQTRRGEATVPSMGGGPIKPVPLFEEVLPGGKHHIVLDQDPNGSLDNTPEFTVPAGHYFMMGDNRDDSADSRYRGPDGKFLVGFVPLENIIGRAELILFSYDSNVPLGDMSQWARFFRSGRWLKKID